MKETNRNRWARTTAQAVVVTLAVIFGLTATASSSLAQGGTWSKKSDMPTARVNLSTSVVDGKIYAIGGWDGSKVLPTVEEYDPATNTWVTKADMPTARAGFTTSTMNGKIYAIGGARALGGSGLSTVEEYDPATNTWTTKAAMPTARTLLSSSAVNGRIYAIGGGLGPAQWWVARVEEYDPVTDAWTKKASLPTARWGLSTCAVDGKIYAIGGANTAGSGFRGGLHTVEVYDPMTDTWESRADVPTRRLYFTASAVEGRIYAIGGNPTVGSWLSTVEALDPTTATWTTKASMPTARWGLSSSTVEEKVYAIGGSSSSSWNAPPLAIVEEYAPGLATSVEATPAAVPVAFALHENYPNPFNPATTLRFDVPVPSPVRLSVYDVLGREVGVLTEGAMPAGRHEAVFAAGGLPSGLYVARLVTPEGTFTRTIVLLK